jgi:MFS family permease
MAIWTTASLICVVLLSAIKLSPKIRFRVMAIGFIFSEVFLILGYLSNNFILLSVFAFLGALFNTAGNTVFNASLMLALPEKNRNAILGFIQSASVGGTAISAVLYGILGDIFPLYIVFVAGSLISLAPMLYLCFNKRTKEFVLSH